MKVGDWILGTRFTGEQIGGYIVKIPPGAAPIIHVTSVEIGFEHLIGRKNSVFNPRPWKVLPMHDIATPELMVELSLILKDREMFTRWSKRVAESKRKRDPVN